MTHYSSLAAHRAAIKPEKEVMLPRQEDVTAVDNDD
jgi:hypothetical protein